MTRRSTIPLAVAILALTATPLGAQSCPDFRLLGHFRYDNAPEETLASVPSEETVRRDCRLRNAVLPDLAALLAAARTDPRAGGRLLALSCFRSVERQIAIFGRERPEGGAADRAISVAPPGYSEHATGYALDFAVRPANGCPDVDACMAASPQARWLLANAPRFGFEQSFPGGNKQQVKWEPWHWRWVGRNADLPDAATARRVFACARVRFPANPAVGPLMVRVTAQPPVPVVSPAPAATPAAEKRR
ncbi:M15 family metallopeptidase [Sphingomonas bacterium]|uniref:M15 family metallopeptidase n=1 Tax=Sphingomonas bacterium TaxID=1895847 RepID=UPI001574EF8B|nr:M15 family metallopeptidase [Sphingomonas bacterium]